MEHQNAVELAEIELNSLGELYRTGATHRASAEAIEVVRGSAAIRQRFTQLQLGARSEVRSLVQSPLLTVGIAENDVEVVAAARGVSYRVVWERRMLDEDLEMLVAVARPGHPLQHTRCPGSDRPGWADDRQPGAASSNEARG
ncbi:hypothetical protein ACFRCW_25385 [Streptomyces sp. NPDC056653]|uniref:hypothetical protein n=1 Tax=Streptomyces sp. NPDC056653 TaxID=3345894 RepID=UPI0036850B57